MRSLIPTALLLSLFNASPAFALNFPFEVRSLSGPPARRLHSRANVTGTSGNSTVAITNVQNAQYVSNITLGGLPVRVLLDTGSSDLWVAENIPGAVDTGKSTTLTYAVGAASGDINTATLQFDDYTVEDQAFLMVLNTSTFSGDIHSQGYDGLMGLGPNTGSVIYKKVDSHSADSVINRIFQQNSTSQNYISFLLNRAGDSAENFTGQLTISEVVPGYESITSMPKMEVELVQELVDENQHWQILTDKDNGIIGPDGQVIKVDSIVPKAPSGQLVAVIDSGFTFPQVPRAVSDAIYGRVQGAVWSASNQIWTIPCGQLLNISFNFGGKNYPVHPLDVVNNDFHETDASGNPICLGAFQPITSAFSLLGNYDLILGMGFLRNTYTLLDYGDFIDEASTDQGNPFVQLLSVTDVNQAHADFVSQRLNNVDTTGASQYALLPASQMQHSPLSEQQKKEQYEEMILSRWPEIFVGCLVFVILLIGCCIWRCCRRRRLSKTAKTNRASKVRSLLPGSEPATTYYPLQDQGGYGAGMPNAYASDPNFHGSYGNGGQGHHAGYA